MGLPSQPGVIRIFGFLDFWIFIFLYFILYSIFMDHGVHSTPQKGELGCLENFPLWNLSGEKSIGNWSLKYNNSRLFGLGTCF